MQPIESRIGYKFSNSLLLAEALTHPSLAYETKRRQFDNQRLEFLGDAVIQVILTERIFMRFPQEGEGVMTQLRSQLVSKTALCCYAEKIKLGDYLLLGKGEETTGGRTRDSNLADAFEALTGAIFVDGGLKAAEMFLISNFEDLIDKKMSTRVDQNPKGRLQEIIQSISNHTVTYELISEDGPDHRKNFVCSAMWNGIVLGTGEGNSKKKAECKAAKMALKEERWNNVKTNENDQPIEEAKSSENLEPEEAIAK